MNELLQIILSNLNSKQEEDIVVLDFENKNPITDYFVIATASNLRLNNALAEYIEEAVYKAGYKLKSIEGKDSRWILLDCYDVIVHLFVAEERSIYDLETLWGDVKRIRGLQ